MLFYVTSVIPFFCVKTDGRDFTDLFAINMRWLTVRWVNVGRYVVVSEHKSRAIALASAKNHYGVVPCIKKVPDAVQIAHKIEAPWHYEYLVNSS